jgi:hypothetical protein
LRARAQLLHPTKKQAKALQAQNDLLSQCKLASEELNISLSKYEQSMLLPLLKEERPSHHGVHSFVGGGKLCQLENAIVADIGGTSKDIGIIKNGYTRRSLQNSKIGGIDLNFSTPDLLSIALGVGNHIQDMIIGPKSCCKDVFQQAQSFGGSQQTFTDIAIAMNQMTIPNAKKIELPRSYCEQIMKRAVDLIDQLI